jgi:hypothetical protein
MNYLGLSEKEFRAIANAIAPDGWVKADGKGAKPIPSPEQIEAVRAHLSKALMMDKKREYLQALVERLRPEVECRQASGSRGRD